MKKSKRQKPVGSGGDRGSGRKKELIVPLRVLHVLEQIRYQQIKKEKVSVTDAARFIAEQEILDIIPDDVAGDIVQHLYSQDSEYADRRESFDSFRFASPVGNQGVDWAWGDDKTWVPVDSENPESILSAIEEAWLAGGQHDRDRIGDEDSEGAEDRIEDDPLLTTFHEIVSKRTEAIRKAYYNFLKDYREGRLPEWAYPDGAAGDDPVMMYEALYRILESHGKPDADEDDADDDEPWKLGPMGA